MTRGCVTRDVTAALPVSGSPARGRLPLGTDNKRARAARLLLDINTQGKFQQFRYIKMVGLPPCEVAPRYGANGRGLGRDLLSAAAASARSRHQRPGATHILRRLGGGREIFPKSRPVQGRYAPTAPVSTISYHSLAVLTSILLYRRTVVGGTAYLQTGFLLMDYFVRQVREAVSRPFTANGGDAQ